MEPPRKKVRFEEESKVIQDNDYVKSDMMDVEDDIGVHGNLPVDENSADINDERAVREDVNISSEVEVDVPVDVKEDDEDEKNEAVRENMDDIEGEDDEDKPDIELPGSPEQHVGPEYLAEPIANILPHILGLGLLQHNLANGVDSDNESLPSTIILERPVSPGSTGTRDCCRNDYGSLKQMQLVVRDEPAAAPLCGIMEEEKCYHVEGALGDENVAEAIAVEVDEGEDNEVPPLVPIIVAPPQNAVHFNNNQIINNDSDDDFFEEESLCSTLCLDTSFSSVLGETFSEESGIA